MDNKKYDVGIYGLWYGRNYGSIITYYALDEVIKSLGYSTVMIKNPLGREGLDLTKLTRSHSLIFADKHYEITPLMGIDHMAGLNNICDRFLLGSDQMWNYNLSRPYKQTYFFDFVDDSKIKVAYATSFGKDKYIGPAEEKVLTEKNLHRFDAISVRDDFSKTICEKEFGVPAIINLDPVFLCEKERYEDLVNSVSLDLHDFIFAYILDPNPSIGASLKKIAQESGKKIVVIFNEGGDREQSRSALGVDGEEFIFLMEATVEEWLYCFKNADFVITDSFHGSCFSIIFEKTFIVRKNMGRGGSRFDFLLGELGLKEYMVTTPEGFVEAFNKFGLNHKIRYEATNRIIKEKKEKSIKWLKDALSGNIHIKPTNKAVTRNLDPKKCMGCGACVSTCPTDALQLIPDADGYYRSTLDYEKCINCGKCTQICPAIKLPQKANEKKPKCFEFVAADEKVLANSSSGGIFPLLANEAFNRNGSVAGAAWRDDLTVGHILIDHKEDLPKLQKSKYLQSYLGNIFRDVKKKLADGTFVLFSGCPCQVAGLKSYLGKEYDNLLLVDLLCGNSPSTLFFQKYLKDAFPDGVSRYQFRNKQDRGWNAVDVKATMVDGREIIRHGGKEDDYQRVYHNHTMCPPHCENCQYQSLPRFGDLTIGDFWGIGKKEPKLDTKKGVSVILCNNQKGEKFLNSIPKSQIKIMKEVPLAWLGGNGYAINGSHNFTSPKRDEFYRAIKTMPFSQAVNYALKPNHGVYGDRYQQTNALLQYDTSMMHFRFDPAFWEEHTINGAATLFVKHPETKPGNYATMPLCRALEKGKTYRLHIRFKANTESPIVNLHVKDSGSSYNQVIYQHKTKDIARGQWVEISTEFKPDSHIYDEFMVGASQISGPDAYIAFDYIGIHEI